MRHSRWSHFIPYLPSQLTLFRVGAGHEGGPGWGLGERGWPAALGWGQMLSRGQTTGLWSLMFTNGPQSISHLKVPSLHSAAGPCVPVRGPDLLGRVFDFREDRTMVEGGSELGLSVSHSPVQMAQEISFIYNCSLSRLLMLHLKSRRYFLIMILRNKLGQNSNRLKTLLSFCLLIIKTIHNYKNFKQYRHEGCRKW